MPTSFNRSPVTPTPPKPPMDFFDCNITIGRRATRNVGSVYTVSDIASTLDHYGIKRALVSHAMCEDSGPLPGNEILLSEIKGHDRFAPCWVLLPDHTGEVDDPESLVTRMAENGVKATKIYPIKHYFSLSEWCTGKILSKLAQHEVPLLIDFNIVHYSDAAQNIHWDSINEICRNYEDLPVILLRLGGNVNRNLFPLLGKFENLHIDISYYSVNDGIEMVCEKFGADHLIFGTGLSTFSPEAPISMLIYSDIPMRDKRAIAYGNLDELLKSALT